MATSDEVTAPRSVSSARAVSPAVSNATPSSQSSSRRHDSSTGRSEVARPRRLIVAGTSPLLHERMPAAPRRRTGVGGELPCTPVGRTELCAVAVRLLEVVADDLVRRVRLAVQPVRETLVQARAVGLRQAVVGDVAHEHVVEAERLLTPGARTGRTRPSRTSSNRWPESVAAASAGERSTRARCANSRPMTAARWSSARSSASSRSSRLSSSASSEGGTSSRTPRPRSFTCAKSCSAKSGLPAVTSTMR